MPFYRHGGKLATQSNINQEAMGNCYIVAPVAAYNLCNSPPQVLANVVSTVGYGMGGSSDRAFRAMGLYPVNRSSAYKASWANLIKLCVDRFYPICLGISWQTLDRTSQRTGNHVVYVIGYEGETVYARDQQNNHNLISVKMSENWISDEYVIGRRTSVVCKVQWVGIGFPNREIAQGAI